jgi:HEAT repeat protein
LTPSTAGGLDPNAPEARRPKDLERPELEDSNAWQLWWNFNRDPLLSLDRWIDERDRETGDDVPTRTARMRRAFGELALPELRKILAEGAASAMVREALLTVARVSDGEIRTRIDLEHYARFFLSSPSAEVRMAAILGLGIQGDPLAIPLLSALVRDDSDAREVVEGPVSERDRSLAALALGMIGRDCTWHEMRREIARSLVATVDDSPWQVGVACVLALGQMPLEACTGEASDDEKQQEGGHVCQNAVLSLLSTLSLAEGEHPWLRAHAASSAGRLARGVEGEIRAEIADVLLYLVDPRADVEPEIEYGALIGLGLSVRDNGDALDQRARESLFAHAEHEEGMARCFAMLALAEVAGRSPLSAEESLDLRELLAAELGRGRKQYSGWAAVALGVLARSHDGQDAADREWAAGLLREAVDGARSPSDASAAALGLGLVGDRSEATRESLLRQYRRFQDPAFRVFGGLALALLAVPEANGLLEEAFRHDVRASLPMRLLGNREVVPALVERAHAADVAQAIEAVKALGQTLAPEAIAPLVEIVADDELDPGLRGAAIASLGELTDQDPVHWTAIYANDLQYRLLTPTLRSPSTQGLGMLDDRVAATR